MLETSISPFPTMFSTQHTTNFNFPIAFNLLSANAFNLDQSKILLFGKDLIATFQLLSTASLNLGLSQTGVIGNGLRNLYLEYISEYLETGVMPEISESIQELLVKFVSSVCGGESCLIQ